LYGNGEGKAHKRQRLKNKIKTNHRISSALSLKGQKKTHSTFNFPRVALKCGETSCNTSPVVLENILDTELRKKNPHGKKNRKKKKQALLIC
jgi:hypothetical protein